MALKSFVNNMDSFFASGSKSSQRSPAKKAPKTDLDEPVLAPASQEWVKTGLAAALTAMGDAVDGRLQVTEAKVDAQGEDIKAMREEIKQIRAKVEQKPDNVPSDMKKEMEALRKEVEEATTKSSKASTAEGTSAICGNLGWDTEPDVLEERCNTLMKEISMDTHVMRVAATRAKAGSSCEVEFTSAAHLKQARLALMAKRKQYSAGHAVWLNFKQTDEQRKPTRMFYRIADFLEMLEADREGCQGLEARKIEKNPKMKSVKVNGRVVGFPKNASWTWTHAAAGFYNEEELQMALSFAESL